MTATPDLATAQAHDDTDETPDSPVRPAIHELARLLALGYSRMPLFP